MNARAVPERAMADDSRIIKLESDVQHLQSDVTEIKSEVKSLRDVIDLLKTQLLSFKADVATEFGAVKTSIERAKLWMVVTGVGTILSVWGAAFALARFLKP
jgi:predicted RNase H-like nuclease (RuvC/YqgF family)